MNRNNIIFTLLNILIFVVLLIVIIFQVEPPYASSGNSVPLTVNVFLNKHRICLNESVEVKATLTNTGSYPVLVDGSWLLLPHLEDPRMSTGALLLSDSSGQYIGAGMKIDHKNVQEDNFIILQPGQSIEKGPIPVGNADDSVLTYHLKANNRYTISVVYQNVLVVSGIFNGIVVRSWFGTVTASEAFTVTSNNCTK